MSEQIRRKTLEETTELFAQASAGTQESILTFLRFLVSESSAAGKKERSALAELPERRKSA